MKKFIAFVLASVCVLGLAGCAQKNEETLHLGLNATIVEIDESNHILYVSDLEDTKVFGGRCAIHCEELIENEKILYVDYETHVVSVIQFTDLVVGDAVIINAYDKYLNDAFNASLKAEQIQLATQRFINL